MSDPLKPPTKENISRHLRHLHGYDLAYAVSAAPVTLLQEHERIHATFAADRINHVHTDESPTIPSK